MSSNEEANIRKVLDELGSAIYEGFDREDREFIQKMLEHHLQIHIVFPESEPLPFDVFSPFSVHASR